MYVALQIFVASVYADCSMLQASLQILISKEECFMIVAK